RRQRMTANNSAEFLELLASYPIQIEPMEDGSATLRLARDFGLTFYDAAYLATAQRNRLPLATLDRALRAAAIAAGVQALE
ncbi:MAG: type II toxin-antitoxin system VapC family toxin, partial [Terracidiphilus sp.]